MFPLHLAALSGFSDCCRKLLSSGTAMLTTFCRSSHLGDARIDACTFAQGLTSTPLMTLEGPVCMQLQPEGGS